MRSQTYGDADRYQNSSGTRRIHVGCAQRPADHGGTPAARHRFRDRSGDNHLLFRPADGATRHGIPAIPRSGYIFEVVTFTVANQGYNSFSTNPFSFFIAVGNTEYPHDNVSYDLMDLLSGILLLDGETVTGSLAFQVPIGMPAFAPLYRGDGIYNIQWLAS
jgi:hypothetical protein